MQWIFANIFANIANIPKHGNLKGLKKWTSLPRYLQASKCVRWNSESFSSQTKKKFAIAHLLQEMFDPFLKFVLTFGTFIVQIPVKYCRKGIEKHILNVWIKAQNS